jgi:hypothetical protein
MGTGGDLASLDLSGASLGELLAHQGAVFDALTARDERRFSADELTGVLHGQERVHRRQNAYDHRLLVALSERITAGSVPVRNAKDFPISGLRVHPGEARARVQASVDLVERRSLTGQVLPTHPSG